MEAILKELQEQIENGAKFNGTVYNKFNGKNWVTLSVYIDGVYTKLGEFGKDIYLEKKREAEQALCNIQSSKEPKTEWRVNDKTVKNNLTYSQMVERYGIGNFE